MCVAWRTRCVLVCVCEWNEGVRRGWNRKGRQLGIGIREIFCCADTARATMAERFFEQAFRTGPVIHARHAALTGMAGNELRIKPAT